MHRNIAVQPSKGSQNIAAKVGNIPDKASRNKPDKVARNIPVRVARIMPDKVLTHMRAKEIGNKLKWQERTKTSRHQSKEECLSH